MMMVMVTMMVNVCDDDCCQCLVMKVILVKEVMSCDVSLVAMFTLFASLPLQFLLISLPNIIKPL